MKNPLPLPAVIAAIVVVVLVIGGVIYHFVQDSQPIYLERSTGGKNKLGGVMKGAPGTATNSPAPQ